MNEAENKKAAYDFYGKMPFRKAFPLGLQHVLAMFVGNLTPILIITGACGLCSGTDFAEVQVALLQNAMLVAGIVTLIQLYAIGPVGGKVPIIMGTSSGFIGVFNSVAGVMGGGILAYGAILGASLIGGLFETVPDGKAKSFTVRTLRPNFGNIRLIEGPQRVEDMLRLCALIAARAEGVNDVPFEDGHELIKADDAGVFRRVREQIARARFRSAGHDRDGGLRRIVAVLHAGGARLFAVPHLLRHGLVDRHLAQRIAQALERQSARAQQLRRRDRQVDDCRLHAHLTGAAVDDTIDLAPHILSHVLCRRAARAAGRVRARRGDRHAGCFNDGARDRMVGTSHADGLEPAGRAQRHAGLFL